jgi:hypothetical protein
MNRLVAQSLLATLTAAVLVLGQSVFWSDAASFWMKTIVVLIAVISFFRPENGLLVLAALTPFGGLIRGLLGSPVRGAEAMVLAFLAGALMHGWTLGEFRSIRWTSIKWSAALFAAVVATSCIEQLWFSQVQTDYASGYLSDFAVYVREGYLTSFRGFGVVFSAMLFIECLALLLYGIHFCRTRPGVAQRLIRMIVIGAAGGAIASIAFATSEIMQMGEPAERFFILLIDQRWSAQVGDINAAGSFFAMTAVIAAGMAFRATPYRVAWMATSLLLMFALAMTRSRTALIAIWIVGAALLVRACIVRRSATRWVALAALLIAIALPLVALQYLRDTPLDRNALLAVNIRWWFLETTWGMLQWQPLFGVGIGRYFLWSSTFSPPELRAYYFRENAHNNFAQVAGELGIVGLAAFGLVLVVCLFRRRKSPEPEARSPESEARSLESGVQSPGSSPIVAPVLAGLAVFIVSWLGGHPLLVAEMAYPFWMTLAIVAGARPLPSTPDESRTRDPDPDWKRAVAFSGCAVILAASVPLRVHDKLNAVDLSGVDYGFVRQRRAQADDWPRGIDSRARIFVPARARGVSIRLRSPSASFDQSEELVILVNGKEAQRVQLADRGWITARVPLPLITRRFHELDLELDDDSRVEIGGWEIISKPDG